VNVLKLKRNSAPLPKRLPLSVSRSEMLVAGSDREFRRLIYRLLLNAARLEAIREAIARRIGVTGTQYVMLMSVLYLQGNEGISIGAVADYLEVTSPHVTSEIRKLVARGLVRKAANPRDRRGVLVRLTPDGRRQLLQIFEFICAVNNQLFDGVTTDEFRVLARFNERFVRNTQATVDWIERNQVRRRRHA
jgi:MarR family transcriptional regulator, organic hydroperoxide resistance regulator